MPDPDFSTFTPVHRGNRYEDFSVGQCFEHHWGRTIHAAESTLFATVMMRFSPMYFNAEAARGDGHPEVVVDPLLALCTVLGLSVEDLSEAGGPFLGVDEVRFHRPMYPGDTLSASSEVVAMRESTSRPDFGIVTWRTEGRNQGGELVVSYQRSNLVTRRRADGAEADV